MKQIREIATKIPPESFLAIDLGHKNFELLKDEHGIQIGDYIALYEWTYDDGYSGASIVKTVKYVLRNAQDRGLMDGYCIIGF